MEKRILLLIVLLLNLMSCHLQSQKTNNHKGNRPHSAEIYSDKIGLSIKQVIDKNAEKTLTDSLINSLSIGIYKDNVSYTFHYGELTKGKGDQANNSTIYEIASITKTFTGTLAAKAVLEGKLHLEDNIKDYLPGDYSNLNYEGQEIKIRHLLTHTAGLPAGAIGAEQLPEDLDELEYNKAYNSLENRQTKNQFLRYLSNFELKTTPGTQFKYSNFGSNLMAYILELVYKKPFQELIMDEIIAKNKMNDTHFITKEDKKGRLATGYLFNTEMPASNLGTILWGGEGALKSTMTDMLKYIHFQFKNNAVVQEAHQKIFEIDTDYWIAYYWWIIENQNHDLHYRHDGGIARAKSILVIYPEKKIGISIITNQSAIRVNGKLNELVYGVYNDLKKTGID